MKKMENTVTITKTEYDSLVKIKNLNKEKVCISNRKGQIYEKYLKDKDFLKYIEEFYPIEYKNMRKDFEERRKIFSDINA